MSESLELRPGESIRVVVRLQSSGFLKFLAGLLGPLLKTSATAAAWITDRRAVKRVSGTGDLELPLERITTAFHNTVSGSFALEGNPRDQSLLLELVENGPEVAAALRALGVKVEDETLSPARRFLR